MRKTRTAIYVGGALLALGVCGPAQADTSMSAAGACGTPNGTQAAQQAIDSVANGGVLTVDCVVKIDSPGIRLVSGSNVTIAGANQGGFEAIGAPTQGGRIDAKGPTLFHIDQCSNCTIKDLAIDLHWNGVSGLFIEASINSTIQNVTVANVGAGTSCGICAAGNTGNHYTSNTVHDTAEANGDGVRGMWLGNASEATYEHDPVVTGNHTYTTAHTGIVVHGVAAVIRNNTAGNTSPTIGGAGIKVVPAPGAGHPGLTYIESNTLEYSSEGVQIENADTDGIFVRFNTITGNRNSGVLITANPGQHNTNITVSQNTLTDNKAGINAVEATNLVVSNNQVSGGDNTLSLVGIQDHAISGVSIGGNTFSSTPYGIGIYNDPNSGAPIDSVDMAGNTFLVQPYGIGVYIEQKSGGGPITNITLAQNNCFSGDPNQHAVSVEDHRTPGISAGDYPLVGSCGAQNSGDTVRVNAGGGAYTDPSGNQWSADTGYSGGFVDTTSNSIANTNTPTLYQAARWNSSTMDYQFPVSNGSYQVTLKFADLYFTGAGQRVFNVAINGQTVLTNFDIVQQAGGPFAAVDRSFFVGASNGSIALHFTGVVDDPLVNAIQIVPSPAPTRVNAGGAAYTDPSGNVWSADTGYAGGFVDTTNNAIANTTTPTLYQTARWKSSTMDYQFPVPNGSYQVTLKFADLYFTAPGQRVFSVAANGQTVLTNYDIVQRAGGRFAAVDETFPVVASGGTIALHFTGVVDDPQVNAIEIVPIL